MADLYIYYRVRDDHAVSLGLRVRAMQAQLSSATGIEGQLKRRPGSVDGVQTWMEVYPGAYEGFDAELAAAVAQASLSDFIDGPRHVEIFTDLETCA